jgi:uncharacterized membrane protein YfcA
MARRRKNPYPKIPGFESADKVKTQLVMGASIATYLYARKYKPEWSAYVAASLLPSTFASLLVGGGGAQDSSLRLLATAAPYVVGSVAAYLAYDHFSRSQNPALSGLPVQQGLLIGPHTPTL